MNRAFGHRAGIGDHRAYFNAFVMKDRVGLPWCQLGSNVEEQLLVGAGTGQQEGDATGIAQDHRTNLE